MKKRELETRVDRVIAEMTKVRNNPWVCSPAMERRINDWMAMLRPQTELLPGANTPGGYRNDDPDTSVSAAFEAMPRLGTQRYKVLVYVMRCRHGATSDDVVQDIGVAGAWKRLSELHQGGWIRADGERRSSLSGAQQTIYKPTQKAIDKYGVS